MILYHKSNLVYTVVFPQFLSFQQNNSAQTSVLIFFTSRHYYFFEKLKIVEKQLCKLNCSYGKVSHTLNAFIEHILGILLVTVTIPVDIKNSETEATLHFSLDKFGCEKMFRMMFKITNTIRSFFAYRTKDIST